MKNAIKCLAALALVVVLANVCVNLVMDFPAAMAVTTETGHAPNRVYTDQDGQLHLNGATLYLDELSSGRVVGGRAYSAVSASDTVTAATSNTVATAFAQTYTIPASVLNANSVVKVKALVVVNDASGTDTLTCKIALGSTDLIATTAVNPGATTDLHLLEFELVSRAAAGATASCTGGGRWITNTGGTIAHGTGLLAPTNFATNGTLAVKVYATWSSNTASTSARLEMLNVEIL